MAEHNDAEFKEESSVDESSIRHLFDETKQEFSEIGGWETFKSGEWLLVLIQKSFRNYYERANTEYFQQKYSSKDEEFIANKLTSVARRNASILGAVVGAAVSTDEIVGILTAGEGGVGLPANIAIACTAIASEALLLVKFQLQLVANLAKVYGVPLDPDDPEDILTILAFALGGSVADMAGKFGMKVGGRLAAKGVRAVVKKEVLATIKTLAAKIGVKILQRTIVKYTVPVVSIGIGTGWNYFSTDAMAKIAKKHLLARRAEL